MYLYLKKKNPKTFLVPCYDMDLIWHSHQVCFSFSIASPYYNGLQSSGISFFENHLWSSSVWSSFDPSEIHPEPVQINSLLSLSYFPTAKTLSGEKPFSHVDPYIWAFSQILPSQVPRPTLGSRGTWLGLQWPLWWVSHGQQSPVGTPSSLEFLSKTCERNKSMLCISILFAGG